MLFRSIESIQKNLAPDIKVSTDSTDITDFHSTIFTDPSQNVRCSIFDNTIDSCIFYLRYVFSSFNSTHYIFDILNKEKAARIRLPSEKRRFTRASGENENRCQKCVCRIAAYVDAKLFTTYANSDEKKAFNLVTTAIDSVNLYYRNQYLDEDLDDEKTSQNRVNIVFKNGISKEKANNNFWKEVLDIEELQFQLAYVHIHKNFTPASDMIRYNTETCPGGHNWQSHHKLNAFAKSWHGSSHAHENYCVAHLFTNHDFSKNILGLAYIGYAEKGYQSKAGVCAKPELNKEIICKEKKDEGESYSTHNTAMTTFINVGQKVPNLEAYLVTAHEIGHQLGAEHDCSFRSGSTTNSCKNSTTGSKCRGSYDTGDWLMANNAVSGLKSNNWRFSPCSMAKIKEMTEDRVSTCFQEKTPCGNYRLDVGEECDVGYNQNNACCDYKTCRLKKTASIDGRMVRPVCADSSDICCEGCQFIGENRKAVCNDSMQLVDEKISFYKLGLRAEDMVK